jgi:hypothetical protein
MIMEKLFDDGWWYETNDDNSARFVLGQPGNTTLVCFGVNPSTATPEKLDPTLRRVKGFAKRLGYDGWLMLNLYPQRATKPDELDAVLYERIHLMNRFNICRTLMGLCGVTIWAAWGALVTKRPYLAGCLRDIVGDISQRPLQWITIGQRSQAGHPKHPLYMRNDAEVAGFDIDKYLEKLK